MMKPPVPSGPRIQSNRGLRILPSATTVLAICAGLTSIKFALDGRAHIALALIGAAAILDGIDGGTLVGPQAQVGHRAKPLVGQGACVLASDDLALVRRSGAQRVDGASRDADAVPLVVEEAERLGLGASAQAQAQALEVGRVRKRQQRAQALDESRRCGRRIEAQG
jgi:hypothetical protein